jgi:membrane protease YdiL (CAAX protease family)
MDGPEGGERTMPPAGWYRDPSRAFAQRYWDGERWTDGVSDGKGVVSRSPLPAEAPAAGRAVVPGGRHRFNGWIALLAVGVFLLSSIIGGIFSVLGNQVSTATALVLGAGASYGSLFLACWWISRWRGTGRMASDYGLRYGDGDWWRGIVISFVARLAAVVVIAVVVLFSKDLAGSNTAVFDAHKDSLAFVLCAAVVAVVMAPFFEELFFRGLILQSLEGSFPAPVAIGGQGILFGLAHLGGADGVGNVGLVLSLAAAGTVFGLCARRYQRIVPGMIAHACFNLPLVAVLLANR